jgi:flagellar basal-body rod protein FlgB
MPSLTDALTTRMNYLVARQGVLAGNIANADTPNYLPADIGFKGYLQAAQAGRMSRTDPRHMDVAGASLARQTTRSAAYVQHNGNGVRLDDEMYKMQQTDQQYREMTQIYNAQVHMQQIALGRAQ